MTRCCLKTLLLILLLFFSPYYLLAQEEVESPALNFKDYLIHKKNIWKSYVEEYKKNSTEVDQLKKDCVKFYLKKWDVTELERNKKMIDELRVEAQSLLNRGVKDVFMKSQLLYVLSLDSKKGDLEQISVNRKLNQLFKKSQKTKYTVAAKYMVIRAYLHSVINGTGREIDDLMPMLTKALFLWIKEDGGDANKLRLLYEEAAYCLNFKYFIRSSDNIEDAAYYQKAFIDDLKMSEGIDPWLSNMIQGCYYRSLGQFLLVHPKSPVAEGVCTDLKQTLISCQKTYSTAWKCNKNLPESALAMLEFYIFFSNDENKNDEIIGFNSFFDSQKEFVGPYEWFLRGVRSDYSYDLIYDKFAHMVGNKWRGYSLEYKKKVIKFGIKLSASKRFDTRIPYLLSDMIDQIYRVENNYIFLKKLKVYDEVCEDYFDLESYQLLNDNLPIKKYKNKIPSQHFDIAYDNKSYDEVINVYSKFSDNIDSLNKKYKVSHVYALKSDAKDILIGLSDSIDNLISGTSENLTLDTLNDLQVKLLKAKKIANDKNTSVYFAYIDHLISIRLGFIKGQWVSVPFDERLWTRCVGHANFIDEKNVTFNGSREHVPQYVMCDMKFDTPLEVEVTVSQVNAGFMIGGIGFGQFNDYVMARRFLLTGHLASVFAPSSKKRPISSSSDYECLQIVDDKHSFADKNVNVIRIRVYEKFSEFYINDMLIGIDRSAISKNIHIGLGSLPNVKTLADVNYSNVKLRKIPAVYTLPPDEFDEVLTQIDYYKKQLNLKSGDQFVLINLIRVLLIDGQHAEVKTLLEKYFSSDNVFDEKYFLINMASNYYKIYDVKNGLNYFSMLFDKYSKDMSVCTEYLLKLLFETPPDYVDAKLFSQIENHCRVTFNEDYNMYLRDAMNYRAIAHSVLGDFDKSVKYKKRYIWRLSTRSLGILYREIDTARHDLDLYLARDSVQYARRSNDVEGTIRHYKNKINNNKNVYNYIVLLHFLYEIKNYQNVIDYVKEAISLGYVSDRLYEYMGKALLQLKQPQQALKCFDEGLKCQPKKVDKDLKMPPDNEEIMMYKSYILSSDPNKTLRDGELSLILAKKLCVLSHNKNPIHLRALSAAFAECGKFDEAVLNHKKILSIFDFNLLDMMTIKMELENYKKNVTTQVSSKRTKFIS